MSLTVLVAGSNRGVGLELSRQYAQAGWRVIAGCRTPDSAAALKELAERHHLRVHPLDTASDRSVSDLAASLDGESIDVLIAVAGVPGGDRQGFSSFDFDALADTLNVNAAGPLRLAQAFAPNLSAAANGKLVALGSQMGSIEQTNSTEMMAYRISKAALNEAWKCVSIEMRDKGVTAMVIHPGWVATDMGGKAAPVSPQASAAGIRAVIDELRPLDAGSFRTFEGKTLPW